MLHLNWNQYLELKANPSGKYHSYDAYTRASTLDSLNSKYSDYSRYQAISSTHLMGRRLIQFRSMVEDRATEYKYCRHDENGDIVYGEDGKAEYYSEEEMIHKLGSNRYRHWFAAFDIKTGKAVGCTQDEWGCLLTLVAPEYSRLGIGAELTRLQIEKHPEMDSGGFTPQGYATRHRMHSSIIRRHFANGYYRKQYKAGKMSIEQIRSIREDIKQAKPRFTLSGEISCNQFDVATTSIHSERGCIYMYNEAIYTDKNSCKNSELQEIIDNENLLAYAYILESEHTCRLFNTWGQNIKSEQKAAFLAIASLEGKTVYIDTETVKRLSLDKHNGLARTDEPLDSMNRIPFRATVNVSAFLQAHNRKHDLFVKKYDPYYETSYNLYEKLVALSE